MREIVRKEYQAFREGIIAAINEGNAMRAFDEIGRTRCIPYLRAGQRWELDYWEMLMVMFYTDGWDYDDMVGNLLALRERAIVILQEDGEERSEDEMFDHYLMLLYFLLRLLSAFPDELARYDWIAEEFYELVADEEVDDEPGMDFYSFAHLVMGVICAVNGETLLRESFLLRLGEATRGKKTLSVHAFLGLYHLAETEQLLEKKREAAELHLRLLKVMLGDGEIVLDGSFGIEKSMMKMAFQGILLSIVEDLAVGGRPDAALTALEEIMFETGIIRHDEREDFYWRLCIQYLQLMDQVHREIEPERLKRIEEVLSECSENELIFRQKDSFDLIYRCLGEYYLAKARRSEDAIRYIDRLIEECIELCPLEWSRRIYLSHIIAAMRIYEEEDEERKMQQCGKLLLDRLASFYAMAELDESNEKLEQYVSLCNDVFKIVYAAARKGLSLAERLEYRMNYKNVLGCLLHLRNKCDDIFKREKTEFDFRFFHYSQLMHVLPERTIVVDFFYYNGSGGYMFERAGYYRDPVLEIIAVSSAGDGTRASQVKGEEIADTKQIHRRLEKLMEVIASKGNRYKKIGAELFEMLFGSLRSMLEGAKHILLSPDYLLSNAPFDLLFEAAGLPKDVDIIYITSLRSIFEKSYWWEPAEGSCMIGAPTYQMSGRLDKAMRVGFAPLPFSGYEAEKLAGMLDADCFVGPEATKYAVMPGYGRLHIATHGLTSRDPRNLWHESGLAFAGIVDYLMSEREDSVYGNGILSADEISRMRLGNTELVVLSACNSGQSRLSELQQQSGLHIAFGAAGVKYVVSALWKVDDLATVFLMSFFYQEIGKGVAVPGALGRAKRLLCGTTVVQLLTFLEHDAPLLPREAKEMIVWLRGFPEDYQPYAAPYYWDAFVCCQYKF